MHRFAWSILAVAAPALSMAQAAYSPQYTACMNKSDGATATMIECITDEAKAQDARLNDHYKKLLATLTPPRKAQLQEAQRAWIRFRDLNCKFYVDPDGGSMARVQGNECFLRVTADRANELKVME